MTASVERLWPQKPPKNTLALPFQNELCSKDLTGFEDWLELHKPREGEGEEAMQNAWLRGSDRQGSWCKCGDLWTPKEQAKALSEDFGKKSPRGKDIGMPTRGGLHYNHYSKLNRQHNCVCEGEGGDAICQSFNEENSL